LEIRDNKKSYKNKRKIAAISTSFLLLLNIPNVKAAETSFDYEINVENVHFNWGSSSPDGKKNDYFTAKFNQSKSLTAGDYFVQTLADDGVRVKINDGTPLIDRFGAFSNKEDRALWLGVSQGNYNISTEYTEILNDAAVFSDVVKFDSWLAYYYPNDSLRGLPAAAKVIEPTGELKKLVEDSGMGSPASGIPADHYSAKYTTAKRIQAGEYIVTTKADDGVRIYIDGQLVLDRWNSGAYNGESIKVNIGDRNVANPNEKNIHWVDIQYREDTWTSGIEFFMEPYSGAITSDSWLGEFYPNKALQGTPVIMSGINELKFNWGNGSPHYTIPNDNFSARFTKKVNITDPGFYTFDVAADDGVKVWLDDKLIMDIWKDGINKASHVVNLAQGEHTIRVEYYEYTSGATLSLQYSKIPHKIFKDVDSVHYNWGAGSPTGLPNEYYTAEFQQIKSLAAGDYFIQALADDGVRVKINNGNPLIDRFGAFSNSEDRALWLGVTQGSYTISTEYLELLNDASLFSDVVKFDSWLAYYYPNDSLRGLPTAAKVIEPTGELKKLVEDSGMGSPALGIPADHYSAKYTTAKRIQAGEYIVRTKADDGVRIYIDGQLVLDRWNSGAYNGESIKVNIGDRNVANPNEKNIHWVDIQYREDTWTSGIEFFMEPYSGAITSDSWLGEFYPNKALQGTPVIMSGINELKFNWGNGSPHYTIPNDNFSARFTKKVNITDPGFYTFDVAADDGVKVWLDDKLIMDIWKDGINKASHVVNLAQGEHTIRVEYYEYTSGATLSLQYSKIPHKIFKDVDSVHYNWGAGSPTGLPNEYYTAEFQQIKSLAAGDYFIQALADDGVRVKINNGNPLIDRFGAFSNSEDRALWLGVTQGSYTISTEYLELLNDASLFSDVVKFDSWLAYYYPNDSLRGLPTAAKVIEPTGELKKLVEDSGMGSPASGIPADYYSAKYTTAKRIQAGEYIVRTKADDGVRIYIDGQLVLDRWNSGAYNGESIKVNIADRNVSNPNEKNIHWIDIQYREDTSSSGIEFFIEPFNKAASQDSWLGEIFPNESLQGTPVIIGGTNSFNPINKLTLNWGYGSPHYSIATDHYSARFTKNINLNEAGNYVFGVKADDGVRVFVDGHMFMDAWTNNTGKLLKDGIYLEAGQHEIVLEYYELANEAYLNFEETKISNKGVYYQFNKDIAYNWGYGSPAQNIPAENFEALFENVEYFSGGDYFIQSFADDGVAVDIDGINKIDRMTSYSRNIDRALTLNVSQGEHTITTRYKDIANEAAIFSNVVKFGSWVSYYYPNTSLNGLPAAAKVINPNSESLTLNENYGNGSPINGIGIDQYSARFSTAKRINPGEYILSTNVDDGIRVYIDGILVIDRWNQSAPYSIDSELINITNKKTSVSNEANIHWIDIEYREDTSDSYLEFELKPLEQNAKIVTAFEMPIYRSYDELSDYGKHLTFYNPSYTRFGMLSYGDIVYTIEENRYATKIKTVDGKIGWVHTAYLDSNRTEDLWMVKASKAIRVGPGTNYASLSTVNAGEAVYVLDNKVISGQYQNWYEIQTLDGRKGWIWGALYSTQPNTGYNLIKYEFSKAGNISNDITPFTPLNTRTTLTAEQINQFIAFKTAGRASKMAGMGEAYIKAQEESGLNAIYLLAHSGLETGWGTSKIVNDKYNFYGIGAIDSDPVQGAYTFDTPAGGIIAGSLWISKNYTRNSPYPQPTIDSMRFNGSTHQYAQDEAWVSKIVYNAQEIKKYFGLQ
jgi:beta-N-acetylglucosaminidase/Zn-finger nucleic acid-binding protein/SH3-like domain-containing protein/ribosomal protein L31E